MKAKETPMEVLRQPRTTKNVEIISFIAIYNPNNLKLFFNNKSNCTVSNIFQKKRSVNYMSEAPNPGKLLCSSKIKSLQKNH